MDKPPSSCNPLDRAFPTDWKPTWFRRRASLRDGLPYPVVACPHCDEVFDFRSLGYLECDHVWPYSLFGDTTWDNLQLLCGRCNRKKSNLLSGAIRRALGNGAFRALVANYLAQEPDLGAFTDDPAMQAILKPSPQ